MAQENGHAGLGNDENPMKKGNQKNGVTDEKLNGNGLRNEEDTQRSESPRLNATPSKTTTAGGASPPDGQPAKPSKMKKILDKMGLDVPTVLMMFKGSVAPLIGTAFYQADSVAKTYSTIGYLIPIVTVLSIPIMPRAKFLQTMFLNIIACCLACAVSLLGIWSSIQARINTSVPPHQGYNSSQSAVCAIWLIFTIWLVNTLSAKVPAFKFPVIIYSIVTIVAFSYGPIFPNVTVALSFIKQLLTAFLTAFGLATGVNLFIVPVSSRTVVFKEQAGYIGLIRKTIKAEVAYLQSLESGDMFGISSTKNTDPPSESSQEAKSQKKKKDKKEAKVKPESPQTAALKGSVAALIALHSKLNMDLPFAKREFAYGKLCADDIQQIYVHLRSVFIPLTGITTIADIFERIARRRGWNKDATDSEHDRFEEWERPDLSTREEEKKIWNEIMKALHEPFEVVATAMDEALQHASIVLELTPAPKKSKKSDVEAAAGVLKPGDTEFAASLKSKMADFYRTRGDALKTWAKERNLQATDFDHKSFPANTNEWTEKDAKHRRDQQQLYLILYLEHLLYSTGIAVFRLTDYADKKVADGTMSKKRFIFPGRRRLRKWFMSIGSEDQSIDNETPDNLEEGSKNLYMGAGFGKKKDPEHLPPKNAWQKIGNVIRKFPRFMGSTESAHGFRVMLATFSVAILGFLRSTQSFFMQERIFWAMIIIAIGMTMTSGQSMFGFFGRVAGTTLAMVVSIVIWYIPNQETWGVIILLWFVIFIEMYFFIKFPRFIAVFLVTIVTQVLIVGYELQVLKIGIAASTASGQRYLPIYELAPYRLATVAAGSFIAFFWTLFPYAISDRSWLRQDLGSTLYLLANFYSIVHATVQARFHGTGGNMSDKRSPGRRLEKARLQTFGKLLQLLPSLSQHAEWQKWELTLGGNFPRKTYEGIIVRSQNILRYLALISFATNNLEYSNADDAHSEVNQSNRSKWLQDFTMLTDKITPTSHQFTSTLSLLSASVRTGTALPPYIQLPDPYNLTRRLEELDGNILSVKHVEEPWYSAYAVMQVASNLILDDLNALVEHVKELVGETNFEFGEMGSRDTLDSDVGNKGKRD